MQSKKAGTSNHRNTPDLIVSVESRKGGVGKTTAALCLGRLLQEKGYGVLFLDLDVTGTNAADIADSPFWKNDLHIIRETNKGGPIGSPVNLIKLFDKCFMAGKVIKGFSIKGAAPKCLYVDPQKVNVLGSQIYTDGNGTNDRRKTTCIERPGILFDDLHTIWLMELVQQVSNGFARVITSGKKKKCAVILDNSPGYVGIAPAVNEWLTDLGPECGKFLVVTSLDTQDLYACEGAVDVLHDLYRGKWETSRYLIDAGEIGSDFHVRLDQEAFFLRLASSPMSSSQSVDPLVYYKDSSSGKEYYDNPSKYIAVVINRVPRAFKSGKLSYDLQLSRNLEDGIFARILGGVQRKQTWREWMVPYDEYIENQFLLSSLQRSRGNCDKPILLSAIEALGRAEKELSLVVKKSNFYPTGIDDFSSLYSRLLKAHDIVSHARSMVADVGLEYFARLVHDEWLPGSIVTDIRKALSRFLRESGPPHFATAKYVYDTSADDIRGLDKRQSLKNRILLRSNKQLSKYSNNQLLVTEDNGVVDMLATVLSDLIFLSFKYPLKFPEISDLFATVLFIELLHWKKRGEVRSQKLGIQRFLAQESVTPFELRKESKKKLMSFPFLRDLMMKDGETAIADFYSACTAAQARLIDFEADSVFLLKLLRFIVEQERDGKDLFPFVKGIAEDVIVRKTIIHDVALEKMTRATQTAEYFGEFDRVLSGILKTWGVKNG